MHLIVFSVAHRHVLCVSVDLTKIMAESRDYDELLFAWQGWRNASGRLIRDDYKRYVQLANKAAVLNGEALRIHRRGQRKLAEGWQVGVSWHG